MVRRRGNIWVWVIGIPVILGAVAHWGMYYFVKSKVDAFILDAAPRAAIHYEQLDTSLGGKVTLSNVTVVPTGFSQGAMVGTIQLRGPDVFSYLLAHLPILGEEGPPDFLDVIIRRAVLDISGERAGELDRQLRELDPQAAEARDVCKLGGNASFTQLQELGFDQVETNARMGYRHIPGAQKFYVDMEMDFKDMQKVTLSAELNNVPALDMRRAMAVALANLKVEYFVPPEFGHKIAEYCGRKRGLTAEQYSELLADDLVRELNRGGLILGYGLTWALKNYVKNWGSLLIELSPPRPLGMVSLINLPREELPEKLGLQLAINGQLVTDLYFSIHENAALLNKSENKPKRVVKPRIRYRWEYRRVSLGQLSSYLDHQVRVKTRDGVVHVGKLVGTRGNKISVQKKISGGKFIAHLTPSSIGSVEVRVKVKVQPEKSAAQETVAQQAKPEHSQTAAE